ncbi:hypothetical protein Mgra_00006327 [Meloidogyne graminicola]|uniref:Alpha-1,6-mannosyl-glycoprotein 2-beta-N-acetylglucosaminyltransferase n=1 Tax=Meloidogyne graminicola TaxID=189291 RepID=A0A8S9ZLL4_9BILA|nr:hypothetical protein Mgra_00006327 [Meloidogyne graminicola]
MNFIKLRRHLRQASGLIFASSILLFVFSLIYISLSQRLLINERFQPRGTPYNNEQQKEVSEHSEREEFLRNASWTMPQPSSEIENADAILHKFSFVDPNKALDSIQFLNENHEVLNAAIFGPLDESNINYIIVVQVHDRIDYLKYLIGSLSRAKGIEKVLLVFSHDMISAPINAIIQSINFCRVIQIFFPYTFQLFPNLYPGESPNDCPASSDKEKAAGTNCVGYEFPDVGGHYRNPKLTQIKHHWWWKMNFLFDSVMPTYGLENKLLILLEEDHLVTPDFLYVLNFMEKTKQRVFPDCELLCLGSYPKQFNSYKDNLDKLAAEFWFSSKFNMGLVLGKNLWEKIRSKNCSNFFCNYDDYNWDWTLMQLSVKCLPTRLRVIYAEAPRVIHIGDCGVHTHNCEANKAVHNALKLFAEHNSSFFPPQLNLNKIGKQMLRPSKPNGGWGDPRDRKLCELNTYPLLIHSTEKLALARNVLEKNEELKNENNIRKEEINSTKLDEIKV